MRVDGFGQALGVGLAAPHIFSEPWRCSWVSIVLLDSLSG